MSKQHLVAFLYLSLAYAILRLAPSVLLKDPTDAGTGAQARPTVVVSVAPATEANRWFETIKPFCNSVEADTRMRLTPPPASFEGSSYAATCYALAGRIARARAIITKLEADKRWQAAGVVFNVAHPVADAGDDLAAGPIMELVVEFWPNHYQALYHAGAARFEKGHYAEACDYLTRFLGYYGQNDGWRSSALSMLQRIEASGEGCIQRAGR